MTDINGRYEYDTLELALEAANDTIGDGDEGWKEDHLNEITVGLVTSDKVTHIPQPFNIQEKPSDDKLDEDECNEEGTYWGEWDYICEYKMEKI